MASSGSEEWIINNLQSSVAQVNSIRITTMNLTYPISFNGLRMLCETFQRPYALHTNLWVRRRVTKLRQDFNLLLVGWLRTKASRKSNTTKLHPLLTNVPFHTSPIPQSTPTAISHISCLRSCPGPVTIPTTPKVAQTSSQTFLPLSLSAATAGFGEVAKE